MKFRGKTCLTFQLLWLVCVVRVKSDVLTARVGDDVVLNCNHSIKNFILVTWKGNFLNQSSCSLSTNGSITHGDCSNRMHLVIDKNKTSLTIDKCAAFDEGNYTCEIANRTGTFFYTVALRLLAEPLILLKTGEDGYPVCQAIGGKPAANISWAPAPTYGVMTLRNLEQDGTTTVISSYNSSNLTDVTCTVSHPTFKSPIEKHLIRPPSEPQQIFLILGVIAISMLFVLLLGIILFWKRSNLRICFSMKTDSRAPQDNPVFEEEVEPYASFTEKINTIYNYSRGPAEYNIGADRTGEKTYR